MCKPGVLAQARATYSILSSVVACIGCDSVAVFSGPGYAHQETISSYLNNNKSVNEMHAFWSFWQSFLYC